MTSRYKEFSESEIDYFGKNSTKLCNIICSIKKPSNLTNQEFIDLFSKLCEELTNIFIRTPLMSLSTKLSDDEADIIISNMTNLAIRAFNTNTKCLGKIGSKKKKTINKKESEKHIRTKLAKAATEYNEAFKSHEFSFIYFACVLSCFVSELTNKSNKETIQTLLGDLTKADK